MIVTTAGHVDHGKTRLIHALTGVDTDRLAEEKRRGLSIDLGFAYLPVTGAAPIGFVDVPGHQRFVRNALCGLAAADYLLLVVAADEGPMPQTREHLAIADLLGFEHGAVAISCIDRVTPDEVEAQRRAIVDLLAGTSLDGAPVFAVSATRGDGIDNLQRHLRAQAAERSGPDELRSRAQNFRLAVDRRFELPGAGLIVTGTVFSGTAEIDMKLRLAGHGESLRLRDLRVQDQPASAALAGQRCALNLSGPGLRRIRPQRGDWIVAGSAPPPVTRFDARLRLLAGTRCKKRRIMDVHLHHASSKTTARLALLQPVDADEGNGILVQLATDKPLSLVFGDRFILRDRSARETLGGGYVLDIDPPRRGRARPERLSRLTVADREDAARALHALLPAAPSGLDLEGFAAARNLTPDAADRLLASLPARVLVVDSRRIAFAENCWQELVAGITDTLGRDARTEGMSLREIATATGLPLPRQRLAVLLDRLVVEGGIERARGGYRPGTPGSPLPPAELEIWDALAGRLRAAAPKPLCLAELQDASGLEPKALRRLLGQAGRAGLVLRLSRDLLILPTTLREIGQQLEQLSGASRGRGFSVADVRDRLGIGRNRCIELLEIFDARRITVRDGNCRRLLPSAASSLEAWIGQRD